MGIQAEVPLSAFADNTLNGGDNIKSKLLERFRNLKEVKLAEQKQCI